MTTGLIPLKARRGWQSNNTSGYRGVSWHRGHRRWQSQIIAEGRHMCLGYFRDPAVAASAYDVVAYLLWGDHARLNAPLPDVPEVLDATPAPPTQRPVPPALDAPPAPLRRFPRRARHHAPPDYQGVP